LPQYFHFEDQDPSNLFLVREWVDGQTLKDWAATPRPWKDKLAILNQLADALSYLHSHQVIHRDLSPKNVLVCHGKLLVKLIDTGFAAHETELVMGGGTPGFAAPEQLQGAAPTPQHDVYAFGKLMALLFPVGSAAPRGVHALIEACTCSNPGDRPQGLEEVSKQLAQMGESPPPGLRPIAPLLLSVLVLVWLYYPATQKPGSASKKSLLNENPAERRMDIADKIESTALPKWSPPLRISNENVLFVSKEDSIFVDSLVGAHLITMRASIDSTSDLPKATRLRILLPKHNMLSQTTQLEFDAWQAKQKAKGRLTFASNRYFTTRFARNSQEILKSILK
jgi:serine/threonine protein kinase